MKTSLEPSLFDNLTLLFMIILFSIISTKAIVTTDEKKADQLRLMAVALSYFPALMMVSKFRIDIFAPICSCLSIVIFITLVMKNEILRKIFVKWIVNAYMVLVILALILFYSN